MKALSTLTVDRFWKDLSFDRSANVSSVGDFLSRSQLPKTSVVSSKFELLDKIFRHYMIQLEYGQGKEVVGHGRSEWSEDAFIKAFSESLERFALRAWGEHYEDNFAVNLLWNSQDYFLPSDRTHQISPQGFRNSNGWAAHPSLREAVKRSLFEAIERHSLQLLYWQYGFSFLRPRATKDWSGYSLKFAESRSHFSGIDLEVCAVGHPSYEGFFFGHQATPGMSSGNHAAIEAYQLAEAARMDPRIHSVFDQINFEFAKRSDIKELWPTKLLEIDLIQATSLEFAVIAIDIGEKLKMGFPYYVACAYSDYLFPLYLEPAVSESEKNWFRERLKSQFPNLELTQTPFV
jgi:hypothetical protein